MEEPPWGGGGVWRGAGWRKMVEGNREKKMGARRWAEEERDRGENSDRVDGALDGSPGPDAILDAVLSMPSLRPSRDYNLVLELPRPRVYITPPARSSGRDKPRHFPAVCVAARMRARDCRYACGGKRGIAGTSAGTSLERRRIRRSVLAAGPRPLREGASSSRSPRLERTRVRGPSARFGFWIADRASLTRSFSKSGGWDMGAARQDRGQTSGASGPTTRFPEPRRRGVALADGTSGQEYVRSDLRSLRARPTPITLSQSRVFGYDRFEVLGDARGGVVTGNLDAFDARYTRIVGYQPVGGWCWVWKP
ncbi:hypothetical protein KM043_007337 [Ampulex compressa]|nr:hypothetical protein KM043_007337 [Ampulex compressa]